MYVFLVHVLLRSSVFHNHRHSELSFNHGEVRFVDIKSIPARKELISGLFKCLKPPNCT